MARALCWVGCRVTSGSGSPISAPSSRTSSRGRESRSCSWARSWDRAASGITTRASNGTSLDRPLNAGLRRYLADLSAVYRSRPELWRGDPDPEAFSWLDADDSAHSIFSYFRRDGDGVVIAILNLTPVPRHDFRVGAPRPGRYRLLISSDADIYGGSGFGLVDGTDSEPVAWQRQADSFRIGLPPLGAVLLAYVSDDR